MISSISTCLDRQRLKILSFILANYKLTSLTEKYRFSLPVAILMPLWVGHSAAVLIRKRAGIKCQTVLGR